MSLFSTFSLRIMIEWIYECADWANWKWRGFYCYLLFFFFRTIRPGSFFFFFWRFIVVTGGFLRSTVECVYLRAKIHHLLLVCVSPWAVTKSKETSNKKRCEEEVLRRSRMISCTYTDTHTHTHTQEKQNSCARCSLRTLPFFFVVVLFLLFFFCAADVSWQLLSTPVFIKNEKRLFVFVLFFFFNFYLPLFLTQKCFCDQRHA